MATWGKTTAFKFLGGELVMKQPGEQIDLTERRFRTLKTKAMNVKPAFDASLPIMFDNEEDIFAAEGIPSWPKLSPAYAAWKSGRYPGMPIMRRTDRLYNSLTSRTSDTVWSTGPRSLRFGTKVPYWPVHQYGSRDGTLPARPTLVLLPHSFRAVFLTVGRYLNDLDAFTPPVAVKL